MEVADQVVVCDGWASDPHWWPSAVPHKIMGKDRQGRFKVADEWRSEEDLMLWEVYIATRTLSEGATDSDDLRYAIAEVVGAVTNTHDSIIHSILYGKKL